MKPTDSAEATAGRLPARDCSAIPFDHTKIADVFENLRLSTESDPRVRTYLVRNGCNWVDQITFLSPSEMRIFVDNFPGKKLWFSSNLPMVTMEDFRRDVERAGLTLIPQNDQVVASAAKDARPD